MKFTKQGEEGLVEMKQSSGSMRDWQEGVQSGRNISKPPTTCNSFGSIDR